MGPLVMATECAVTTVRNQQASENYSREMREAQQRLEEDHSRATTPGQVDRALEQRGAAMKVADAHFSQALQQPTAFAEAVSTVNEIWRDRGAK